MGRIQNPSELWDGNHEESDCHTRQIDTKSYVEMPHEFLPNTMNHTQKLRPSIHAMVK